MIKKIVNRYGDTHVFTLKECGNIMWEGNFDFCRLGFPNDYTDAYKAYLESECYSDHCMSIDEFKTNVHEYDDKLGKYKYYDYLMMVKSLRDEIDMIDPSGGPYLTRNMHLDSFGFKGLKIKDFKKTNGGYLIITDKV